MIIIEYRSEEEVPIAMDDGVEGEAVLPWIGKVFDADAGVFGCGPLGPSQQRLPRRQRFVLSHHNIRYLHTNKYLQCIYIHYSLN